MRPWMGALAAAAAIAVLPASALADDGESVYEFKLPNKAAGDQLIKLGFDLGDGVDQSQPGFVKATIVATSSEKAQLEAMGYPAVATIQTPADVDRAARRAPGDDRRRGRRQGARSTSSAAKQSKSAAVGHGPRASTRTTGRTPADAGSRSKAPPRRPR